MVADKDKLLEQLGSPYTSKVVERFERFTGVPPKILDGLSNVQPTRQSCRWHPSTTPFNDFDGILRVLRALALGSLLCRRIFEKEGLH